MSHTIKNIKKVKNRETKKIKKLLNEEVRLGLHDETNSDGEEVDLSKDLHSLTHYVNNREEMVEQMFTIISGNSLKKLLPPLLKDMNLEELKAECLIHLLGMSSKRIISILEGREIDSSSESETHSEPSPLHSSITPVKNLKSKFAMKQEGCSDISNDSNDFDKKDESPEVEIKPYNKDKEVSSTHDDRGETKKFKSKKRKSQTQDSEKKKKHLKVINSPEHLKSSESSAESVDDDSGNEHNTAGAEVTQGKTLLEILELEMRAKAIRALLNQGGEEHSGHKDSQDDDEEKRNSSIPFEESRSGKKEKVKIERNYRKRISIPDKAGKDDTLGLITIDLTNEGENSKTREDEKNTLEKEELKALGVENINEAKDDNDSASKCSEVSEVSTTKTESLCNKTEETTESIQKSPLKTSWAERWLQSKDVNKVVSTSKICANIRKRMRNARLAKQNDNSIQNSSKAEPDLQKVEGSVSEYQLLTKSQNVMSLESKVLDDKSGFIQDDEKYITENSTGVIEIANVAEFTDTDPQDAFGEDSLPLKAVED